MKKKFYRTREGTTTEQQPSEGETEGGVEWSENFEMQENPMREAEL